MFAKFAAILAVSFCFGLSSAQNSTFNFQANLQKFGLPANGSFEMAFHVYSVATGGVALQSFPTTGTLSIDVTNGRLDVELTYLTAVFSGPDRFLEIVVDGTVLAPRVKLNPTPYSIFSQNTRGVVVDASNRVGIGQTAPANRLHLGGGSDASLTGGGFLQIGNTGLTNVVFDDNEIMGRNNGAAGFLHLNNDGGTLVLTGGSAGVVGVGTPSPQAKLHVKSNAGVLNLEGSDHCYIQFYPDSFGAGRKGWLGFATATSNALTLTNEISGAFVTLASNSGVGIFTSAPNRRLTVWDTLSVEASPGFIPFVGVVRPGNVAYEAFMYVDTNGEGVVAGDRKSFREINPDDPETDIWYVSIEGPEAAMYVRGTACLVNGRAVIDLPQHFRSLASENGMTVQLTPLSIDSKGLAVVQKSLNGVVVGELGNGQGNYDFDWEVKAVRRKHENYEPVKRWDEYMPADAKREIEWEERLRKIKNSG